MSVLLLLWTYTVGETKQRAFLLPGILFLAAATSSRKARMNKELHCSTPLPSNTYLTPWLLHCQSKNLDMFKNPWTRAPSFPSQQGRTGFTFVPPGCGSNFIFL
jgi:hypothetical protein